MIKHIVLLAFFCGLTAESSFAQDSKLTIGSQAPDFVVTGIEGEEFKVLERYGQGKNLVIMFSRAHW